MFLFVLLEFCNVAVSACRWLVHTLMVNLNKKILDLLVSVHIYIGEYKETLRLHEHNANNKSSLNNQLISAITCIDPPCTINVLQSCSDQFIWMQVSMAITGNIWWRSMAVWISWNCFCQRNTRRCDNKAVAYLGLAACVHGPGPNSHWCMYLYIQCPLLMMYCLAYNDNVCHTYT